MLKRRLYFFPGNIFDDSIDVSFSVESEGFSITLTESSMSLVLKQKDYLDFDIDVDDPVTIGAHYGNITVSATDGSEIEEHVIPVVVNVN